MELILSKLDTYLEALKTRAKTKHRTRIEEITEPYLKNFNWNNDTFFSDMQLFWIKANQYYKRNTEYNYLQLLEWAKDKNLHPKQMCKAFNK